MLTATKLANRSAVDSWTVRAARLAEIPRQCDATRPQLHPNHCGALCLRATRPQLDPRRVPSGASTVRRPGGPVTGVKCDRDAAEVFGAARRRAPSLPDEGHAGTPTHGSHPLSACGPRDGRRQLQRSCDVALAEAVFSAAQAVDGGAAHQPKVFADADEGRFVSNVLTETVRVYEMPSRALNPSLHTLDPVAVGVALKTDWTFTTHRHRRLWITHFQ
jgi:hypothetical protein